MVKRNGKNTHFVAGNVASDDLGEDVSAVVRHGAV